MDLLRVGNNAAMEGSVPGSRDTEKRQQRPGPRPERRLQTTRPESLLHWVTARIPLELVREVDGHAKRLGTTRSDAIRDCLAVGLETIRSREGVPGGRVDEVLGALEGIRATLDLIGPPTFGIVQLLAFWAAREAGSKVSQDELLAEVRACGADEWEQAVEEAERGLPSGPKAGSDPRG